MERRYPSRQRRKPKRYRSSSPEVEKEEESDVLFENPIGRSGTEESDPKSTTQSSSSSPQKNVYPSQRGFYTPTSSSSNKVDIFDQKRKYYQKQKSPESSSEEPKVQENFIQQQINPSSPFNRTQSEENSPILSERKLSFPIGGQVSSRDNFPVTSPVQEEERASETSSQIFSPQKQVSDQSFFPISSSSSIGPDSNTLSISSINVRRKRAYFNTLEELKKAHPKPFSNTASAEFISRRLATHHSYAYRNRFEKDSFLCQCVLRAPIYFALDNYRQLLLQKLMGILGFLWRNVPSAKPVLSITGNAILVSPDVNQENSKTFSFWTGQTFSANPDEFMFERQDRELQPAAGQASNVEGELFKISDLFGRSGVSIDSLSDLSRIPSLEPPEDILEEVFESVMSQLGSSVYVHSIVNIVFILQSLNTQSEISLSARKFFNISL